VTQAQSAGPQRASDQAYELLLDRILDLRIPPGAVVNEQQLALEVGLGRMPVREALARLAGDRFITVLPRRGTVVTALSLEDVLDMFEAREAIQCGVAHIAARKASDSDLAALRRLITAAERSRGGSEALSFLSDDHEIHLFLVRMVNNLLLQDAAERLLKHNLRFWRSYWTTRPVQPASMLSHAPLMAALEDRDPAGAEQAMRDHIQQSRQLLLSAFS
jgi:DNA-binding GntR family transcriptional regulator